MCQIPLRGIFLVGLEVSFYHESDSAARHLQGGLMEVKFIVDQIPLRGIFTIGVWKLVLSRIRFRCAASSWLGRGS